MNQFTIEVFSLFNSQKSTCPGESVQRVSIVSNNVELSDRMNGNGW